jgi:hypothetical protein
VNTRLCRLSSAGGVSTNPRLDGLVIVPSPERVPIHPIVCFEAGWFTLTQSSWTGLPRSRKWMSGHAATALATRKIEDSSEPIPEKRLRVISSHISHSISHLLRDTKAFGW